MEKIKKWSKFLQISGTVSITLIAVLIIFNFYLGNYQTIIWQVSTIILIVLLLLNDSLDLRLMKLIEDQESLIKKTLDELQKASEFIKKLNNERKAQEDEQRKG